MRALTDVERLHALMKRLGSAAKTPGDVYFTGGATALLLGWRATTVDVDFKLEGDAESLLRSIPQLKEDLHINVRLACPSDFIPELPGWRDRCLFIERHDQLNFRHYDLYSQALAKIERNHLLDTRDVAEMLERGLVEPKRLRELFDRIEPDLYRYPAIDPTTFRRRVEVVLSRGRSHTD
jgi:hypothetical protein